VHIYRRAEGQGMNYLGLFLHDSNVSDTIREPLSCLAEAKLYWINDYPRTFISSTKLDSQPVVLCVVVNFTEYLDLLFCIDFSHYGYLLSNARVELHIEESTLTPYSFFNCRYILTRVAHSSQVVRYYRAYVFVFSCCC
jgi:hypothetical protein